MKFTTSLIAVLASVAQLSAAAPSPVEKRDVFVPPVILPNATTVWNKGELRNVTWNITGAPVNITNKLGRVQLRKGGLITPLILADGFDILAGIVSVTVPWVVPGNDYSIVLFGDSGNWSQNFTINF